MGKGKEDFTGVMQTDTQKKWPLIGTPQHGCTSGNQEYMEKEAHGNWVGFHLGGQEIETSVY